QTSAKKEERKDAPGSLPAPTAVAQAAGPSPTAAAPTPAKSTPAPLPAVAAGQAEATGLFQIPRTPEGERLYEAHKDPVKIIQDSPTLFSVFHRLLVNAPRTEDVKTPMAARVVAMFPLKPKANAMPKETETSKETEVIVVKPESKPKAVKAAKAPRS